jgi:hypothetical protein
MSTDEMRARIQRKKQACLAAGRKLTAEDILAAIAAPRDQSSKRDADDERSTPKHGRDFQKGINDQGTN